MRTLLALLLKKISTPGRLKKLGFGTRLIDEVSYKTNKSVIEQKACRKQGWAGKLFFSRGGAGRGEARQKIYGTGRGGEPPLPHNAGRGGEGVKICGVGRGRGGEHAACIS